MRTRIWLTALLAAAVLAAVGIGLWKTRTPTTPEALLLRLPTQDAVVGGIDFDAVRRGGFLRLIDRAKTPEEPEYKAFVHDTGFDYQRDLDSVLVSFAPDGEFFFIRGRFDWQRIEAYATQQKGSCSGHLCKVDGSTPDRHISFFPLTKNVMAMAVAPDASAVERLRHSGPQADLTTPLQPVWVSLSSGALRQSNAFAGAAQMMASALHDASRLTMTLGPAGTDLEARLDAVCHDTRQAGALVIQLQGLTAILRAQAARAGRSAEASDDLGAVLLTGTFDQSGPHVFGHWPVRREVVERLANGL